MSTYDFFFHKANSDMMTEQMDVIKVNIEDDSKFSFLALIEKVAKDEIKKLAEEEMPFKKTEVIKDSAAPLALLNIKVISSSGKVPIETTTLLVQETTKLSATTGSMDLDSETVLPTNAPALETETIKLETILDETTETLENQSKIPKEVETTASSLKVDENVKMENSVSDSLLSAVGDLLSSILGLENKKSDENAIVRVKQQNVVGDNEAVDKAVVVKETNAPMSEPIPTTVSVESNEVSEMEQGTEKMDETATPVGFEGEQMELKKVSESMLLATIATQEKIMNEIDLKIENLANAQTSFATENTPEQVTETVTDKLSESNDNEPDVLEVISDPSNDSEKPVSFEESVNQIMNLVKNSEGHLRDSVLIDKNMKQDVSDLDQIVYGTLKEIDSSLSEENLGMQEKETMESFEPVVSQKIDLIKSFDSDVNRHPFEYDNFVLNSAKAALHYRWQDDIDF